MSKKIQVPSVVQDPAVGPHDHPLRVEINVHGALVVEHPTRTYDTWAYLYPEQVQALYYGLKAYYEGDDATETTTT